MKKYLIDKSLPTHYRYRTFAYDDGTVQLEEEIWHPIKETPRGYWVASEDLFRYYNETSEEVVKRYKLVRFVLKDSGRRFCYPTKKEAFIHLYHRKRKHIQILRSELDRQTASMKLLEPIFESKDFSLLDDPAMRYKYSSDMIILKGEPCQSGYTIFDL